MWLRKGSKKIVKERKRIEMSFMDWQKQEKMAMERGGSKPSLDVLVRNDSSQFQNHRNTTRVFLLTC
jgi:hypothetical protein